jgi:hypothetical protein
VAQINEKSKSAGPYDRPNPFTSYLSFICSIDLMDEGKLGYGFTSADELEEIDIGPGDKPRPTFISQKLNPELRELMIVLLKEYTNCFAWDYTEMPGLDRSIVEHRLPLKLGFRLFQQRARQMKAEVLEEVKKEVEKMLAAGFIRPAGFMDGNASYNQIFMAPEDIHKTTFRVPGAVGLFEYVVMTFGLKNAGATYQRAMNYMFHDLISKLVEIYIDDVVVKSASAEGHLGDLW